MKDKEFQEAIWSLDPSELSSVEGCVQGHATLNAGRGIDIEIPLGLLLERKSVNGGNAYDEEPLYVENAYGLDRSGSFFLVSHVHLTHGVFSWPGFNHQMLRGQALIVSRKQMHPNPSISRFTFSMSGLREWVGVNPTTLHMTMDTKGVAEEVTLKYVKDEIPEIVIYDVDGVRVTVDYFLTIKGGSVPQFEHGLISDYKVSISFENPCPLDAVLEEWVYPVRRFFELLHGILRDGRFNELHHRRWCEGGLLRCAC